MYSSSVYVTRLRNKIAHNNDNINLKRRTVERGNFGKWGNFEQLLKKHLTLSQSFDFLAVVRTSRGETSAKKSKL